MEAASVTTLVTVESHAVVLCDPASLKDLRGCTSWALLKLRYVRSFCDMTVHPQPIGDSVSWVVVCSLSLSHG